MKKAQIKMFETIAILFVFFMLVIFGFIFYAKLQKITFTEERGEVSILKAIQVAERTSFLPEMQCSFDNVPDDDCIDIEKLKALRFTIEYNIVYYFSLFEFSQITVTQIYPTADSWVLYDNPKKNFIDLIPIQLPVSLYNPMTDSYGFGYIDIGVYR